MAADSVAYQKLIIKPQMVRDLNHASGSINTINGEVSCTWSKSDRQVKLEAVIPVGGEALIYIPVFKLRNIQLTEDGTLIFADNELKTSLPGIKSIELKGGNLIVRVGSGRYTFQLIGE